MVRWLLTGAGGQLATEFEAILEGEVFLARAAMLDIRDAAAVKTAIRAFAPDAVIHTAAFTDVDGAEADEETAFAVNALGTRNLVEALRGSRGVPLVTFSTDYVFNGAQSRPYVESDEPGPINAYGRTKLACERETLAYEGGMVIRTAWLFSAHNRNFVRTVLSAARQRLAGGSAAALRVVDDQVGSPTNARHLALAVDEALRLGVAPGLYHMAGAGYCSWCELARESLQLAGFDLEVVPITTAEAGRPAPRPAFAALESERPIPRLPDWLDGLTEVVDELQANDWEALA